MLFITSDKVWSAILILGIVQIISAFKNNAYLLQNHQSYSLVISVTNQIGMKSTGNDSQVFSVQAPKYHRVMMVIQQLHLWPEIEKETQSYLQFVDSDGTSSKKIYGNIDPDETDLTPQYITGPRSFASTEDTASLVFINLQPDHIIRSKNERRVYAKVAFTAFRDTCSYRSLPLPQENSTFIRRHEMIYRSCTTSSASGKNCIAADLFCNGNVNCAETSSEENNLGIDEAYKNCDRDKTVTVSQTNLVADGSSETSTNGNSNTKAKKKEGGNGRDLLKTLIVNQEYDEYFTDVFKCAIIGFLGFCTTCILLAFIISIFCFKNNHN